MYLVLLLYGRWKQLGLCTIAILIPIVQHKMNSFFFFWVILSYNIRPKVITKNKSAECFLSQAQNIIKIWKFTIQKKVKENLKFYSQNRETRVSDATVPVSFFFFKFWCWFVNIFPFFVFFFLMISLGLFMSWLVEFIWFVHDYCSILIICNTAYQ